MSYKIGHGIDIHQLKENLPLILGGVNIDSDLGIVGHSDGDVVIHALVDAILGALAKGDIGTLFPSDDKTWKDTSSTIFLDEALQLMKQEKYSIVNIDINIILEIPHLNPYISDIRKKLSELIQINRRLISIKASTSDKLGYIGGKKGIMSTATLLLVKNL